MTTEQQQGDDLAKQTAQAKLLREARERLTLKAGALAAKKNRKGLQAMGLTAERADELISGNAFNSADLADLLGVALFTLRGWMAPAGTSVHREMPKTAKLLLARILAD